MNNDVFVYEDGTWSREPPTRTRYLVYKIGSNWSESDIDRLVIEELYPIARNFFYDEENV